MSSVRYAVGTRRSRRSPLYHAIHPGWFPVPQVWRNVANQPWQSSQYVLPGGDNTIITPFWRTVFRYLPGVLRSLRLLTFLYLETSTPQFDTTEQGAKMRTQTAKISERYIKATAPGELARSLLNYGLQSINPTNSALLAAFDARS